MSDDQEKRRRFKVFDSCDDITYANADGAALVDGYLCIEDDGGNTHFLRSRAHQEAQDRRRRAADVTNATQRIEADRILAWVEERKAANPRLSDKAAARRYLEGADPDWHKGPDSERAQKVSNLIRRLSRARKRRREKP